MEKIKRWQNVSTVESVREWSSKSNGYPRKKSSFQFSLLSSRFQILNSDISFVTSELEGWISRSHNIENLKQDVRHCLVLNLDVKTVWYL